MTDVKNKKLVNTQFGTEKVWKLLLKMAPPVMFAQLIQSLYNIVDSYFVGKNSEEGLTALSVIYPIQFLIGAFAIGTGVGVNTIMAKYYGLGEDEKAKKVAGIGNVLAFVSWVIFAVISCSLMKPYVHASAQSDIVRSYAAIYGKIICAGSLGIFMESMWTKVHQAIGNMKIPMIAQVTGAVINIILDPILIFGWGQIKPMGVAGAAIATIIGQVVAAMIVGIRGFYRIPSLEGSLVYIKHIYIAGIPNILMQALWTLYIAGLNMVLVSFSDAAVTVLGLYYKVQSFFFIPLTALGVCIVPVLSYNYAINDKKRCKKIFWDATIFAALFMVVGVLCFTLIPNEMIGIFSKDKAVHEIGRTAFRIIGTSFIPAALSLTLPVYFQAIGKGGRSIAVTVLRQVILFVPVALLLARLGLNFVWFTFPITELVTCAVGMILYKNALK